jgi:hypothetical protein
MMARGRMFALEAPDRGFFRKTGTHLSARAPTKNAAGWLPPRLTLELAGPGLEAPRCQAKIGLAGDPSEVTALETRHWITSFHC